MVRSGAVGPYGGATYQDGIHLNFASGNTTSGYYVKAVGAAPTVSPLTSLFTFTGGNQSMYMGPAGLLVASATNTPRIEYDANGACLGLLMEAARTNLCLQSQDWSTSHSLSAINAFGAGSTVNATTAPDGTVTADKITEDTATTLHRVRQTTDLTITSGSTNTFSVFVKAAERTKVQLRTTENTFATSYECLFDLAAGTAGTPTVTGATAVPGAARITALPNGWFRLSITGALNGGFTSSRNLIELADASGSVSYTGDGTSGLFIWGEQFEAGAAFPSSYIPTTTGSVARTADSCIRTLGSEFSATAGTVVVAGRASGGQDAAAVQGVWSTGAFPDTIFFQRNLGADIARYNAFAASAAQGPVDGTFANLSTFKAAMCYATNDMALSFNGAAIVSDTSFTLPAAPTVMNIGGTAGPVPMNGHILRFDYYPTRLPNAFLVSAST